MISPLRYSLVLMVALPVMGVSQSLPGSLSGRALDAFNRGDFEHAISLAHQALGQREDARLRDLLGKSHAATGDRSAALRDFKLAVQLQPDVEQFQFDLAQFLLRNQNFPEALAVLQEAHRRLPQSVQIELALGVANYCCVRYDDAVRAFLRTMELAPDVVQPYTFLGKILEHAGSHLPDIARHCANSERIDPSNSAALLLHAKVLIAENSNAELSDKKARLDTAAHLLERTIALDSKSADAYLTLGGLVADQGNLGRAAELLERGVQLNPGDSNAHYRLGLLYARLGKRARADEEFAAQTALKQQQTHRGLSVE